MLQRSSFHSPKTFKGIPKGEFMRARRICTKERDYQQSKEKITHTFINRGYNVQQIE